MIVLGLDPGYAIVGYGAIETGNGRHKLLCYGAITTPAGMEMSRRLLEIQRDMNTLLDTVKPDALAIALCHIHSTGSFMPRNLR